jgi:hypothetical protein
MQRVNDWASRNICTIVPVAKARTNGNRLSGRSKRRLYSGKSRH